MGLFGAAVAAPALPLASPAISAKAAGLAAAHAQKYPFVSVIGLSNSIGVSTAQAESLLLSLSRKGLVGQVQTCASGAIHAGSPAMQVDLSRLLAHVRTVCIDNGIALSPRCFA